METLRFDEREHRYFLEIGAQSTELLSVTKVLKETRLIGFPEQIPAHVMEAAALRGKYVHKTLELHDLEMLDEANLDGELLPYLDAYRDFKVKLKFTPGDIEKRVHNSYWGYAGTVDRSGLVDGQSYIVDFKTGAIQAGSRLQMVAYANCYKDPRRFGRIALQLFGNGKFRVHNYMEQDRLFEEDTETFYGAVRVCAWRRNEGMA